MARQVGIDLGTTNSVVAFLEGNKPEVIPNPEGNKTTPSVILYRGGEEIIVGELAKRQIVSNPSHTIVSVKRFMGRRINEISETEKQVHYHLVDDPENDRVLIDLGWHQFSPEEVSAEILRSLRENAENFLGETINEAVITVPAYFNDAQRSATKSAGELSGLEVIRIINEPTAAALAYGLGKENAEKVAVFDFGGGTFDISVMDLDKNLFEVLSTNGNTFLGGDNIDHIIFNFLREEIKGETGIDLIDDPHAVQRLREVSEKVKCELSTMNSTTISLPFIVSDEDGPKHYNREFNREEFNSLVMPALEQLIPPCRNALMDAGITPAEIDTIILVGGSTKIPKVQEMVAEFFKKEPLKTVNPDQVVAMGAAVQAGVISGTLEEVLLLDITPISLGIELADDIYSVLIPRNSNIPTSASKKFTTVVDNQRNVFIHVLQGERKRASLNRSLSHFRLVDIAPAPREVPEIEVSFNIDANGILDVSATDLTSGVSEEIRVESYHPSSPEFYKEKIEEAEKKKEEDRVYVEMVRRKERLKKTIDVFKKFLDEEQDNMENEDIKNLQEFISYAEKAAADDDMEAVEKWVKTLFGLSDKYSAIFMKYKFPEQQG